MGKAQLMTNSDHERERRAFYDAIATSNPLPLQSYCNIKTHAQQCHELATAKLAERDKMFPGPVDCELVPCPSCGERVIAEDVSDQCFTKCQKCGANLFIQAVKFDVIALSEQEGGDR
jgi:hypothetical protein